MKLLVDVSGLHMEKWTGIQQYTDGLMQGLCELDVDWDITGLSPYKFAKRDLTDARAEGRMRWTENGHCKLKSMVNFPAPHDREWTAYKFPFQKLNPDLPDKIRRRYWNYAALKRIHSGEIDLTQYDLVHVPEAGFQIYPAYRTTRSVVTVCDVAPLIWTRAYSEEDVVNWKKYFSFATEKCDRIITISEASKRGIVEYLGVAPDRVDVTLLAPRASTRRIEDEDAINATLKRFGILPRQFLLYCGTIEPRKNVDTLLRSFASVIKETRSLETSLVLAGGHWGDMNTRMQALARELEIDSRVIFTGYLSNIEMNVLLSTCQAFAYISEYEGFGLPPLEAMTCGAPVITSNVSSLPEVVGSAGLTVPPKDCDAVAQAIHLLLTDETENLRRRQFSLTRAREFSWSRTVNETLQSYRNALAM